MQALAQARNFTLQVAVPLRMTAAPNVPQIHVLVVNGLMPLFALLVTQLRMAARLVAPLHVLMMNITSQIHVLELQADV